MHSTKRVDSSVLHRFYRLNGWLKFEFDDSLKSWVNASLQSARDAVHRPDNQHWWRYQGTWFVGVNSLDNDRFGKVQGGIHLQGKAAEFLSNNLGVDLSRLDQAQVSVCLPGYPKSSNTESRAANSYRLNKDAAHLDGVLKQAATAERYVQEPHDYILAIPMSDFSSDTAPFVVWEGSHNIVRSTFKQFFENSASENWSQVAITSCYQQVRRQIFSECERKQLIMKPGEAFLVHRLMLHGTGPWKTNARCGPDGRMICFFRPSSLSIEEWLDSSLY